MGSMTGDQHEPEITRGRPNRALGVPNTATATPRVHEEGRQEPDGVSAIAKAQVRRYQTLRTMALPALH